MVKTAHDVFEATLQKTDIWLKKIGDQMNWVDRHKSYIALRAVLHALRDRLNYTAAAKLAAQLPLLIRGFYYEGWTPADTPIKIHSRKDFLDLTQIYLNNVELMDEDVDKIVTVVFHVIKEQLGEKEVTHLKAILPRHIAEIWD